MKKVLLVLIILICSYNVAWAEKVPLRITPSQIISTKNDEIETGDLINFATVKDVYINDKLYIEKGTPIYGQVDFLHPNGWAGDNAEIKIKKFKTLTTKNDKITISSPLTINGNSKKAKDIKNYFSMLSLKLALILRGAEVDIEPDEQEFNIFIEN